MKNYYTYLIFLIIILTNCKEEERGQYPVDNVPPQVVKNIAIDNLPGAVRIGYELPDETDLLYVQAKYELSKNKIMYQKTSAFSNSMLLKGFAKSKKSTVLLNTVDRSRNESIPVEVEIEPLDSPIYNIRDSLSVTGTFGGVDIEWFNPFQEDIMIGVLMKNETTGEFEYYDNFYSSEKFAKKAVRGMDSIYTTLGFFCRDVYMNYTDTLITQVKPLFEEEIPKINFRALPLPSFIRLIKTHSTIDKIWDDNIFNQTNYIYLYINPGNPHLPFFSFDMGVTAKLSRCKVWPRLNYAFELHSPKIWEWWGTNDESAAIDNETLNWENNPAWIKLRECESKRPSGLDIGDPLTTEDTEYIEAGEDFEFPVDAPAVRYLRFKLIKSWSDGDGLNLQEVQFWGQIQ